jgi:hypothetical protein
MDGMQTYQFLFWNTGRHVTNKRHVRWNFSIGGWGLWTATRWYGTPGGGPPGVPRVRVDPFTLGGDAVITSGGTAINSSASTYAPGAFPFMGNDHEIGTAAGAVNVVAKDPFTSLDFAGWLQLIWGGDDSGEFVETDTGASPGSSGFFPSGSGPFPVSAGASADLLATYGNTNRIRININIAEAVATIGKGLPIGPGDPGPDDIRRLIALEQLLLMSMPSAGDPAGAEFQRIIEAAPRMSAEQLKMTVHSVQTTLDLGKAALATIQALLNKAGK